MSNDISPSRLFTAIPPTQTGNGWAARFTAFLECGLDPRTTDARLLRQVRVLNSLMLTALILCIPLGIFWSTIATPAFALVYSASFAIWTITIYWLQQSLRLVLIGRIACAALFGICTTSVMLLGEHGSSMLSWYMLMPLAGAVCVGRQDLWGWGLIASAMPALFFFYPDTPFLETVALSPEVERQLSGIILALGVFVAAILSGIWISHHESLAQSVDESVALLEKKALVHRLLIDTAMLASGETKLKTGARRLLEHMGKLDWVSSISFWDTRDRTDPTQPICNIPIQTRVHSTPLLARAIRTGERSMSRKTNGPSQTAWYPVKDGKSVVGVLEISTNTPQDPDQSQGWLLQQIAIQLGHIAERERTAELIQREARHDSLTSLPNRRAFEDMLEREIQTAQKEEHEAALFFLDLNGFKRVNDSLGHAAGDQVLQVVAERLKSTIRQSNLKRHSRERAIDSISRVGGDEFTLLLGKVGTGQVADTIAQRIIDALASPIRHNGQQFNIGVSIGIAFYPQDAQHADALIRYADDAMYLAKRRGRSGFSRFEASDNTIDSLSFEAEMRYALENHQLEMHYQAVFSCEDRTAVGAEALIRWRHPVRGWISPAEFIPFAEKSGLMADIGHFQFDTVLQWFETAYTDLPDDFRVALNLSPTQVEDSAFINWLIERLSKTTVPMQQLELEITETALLADTPEARNNIQQLAGLGLCITLDDFGTGQSSLSLLKRFRIGRLKIDRSFVSGLPDRNEDAAIVSAVLSLAHSLDIPVVAEGVEHEVQHLFLAHRGCHDMQGFLLGKPMENAALVESLKNPQPHI